MNHQTGREWVADIGDDVDTVTSKDDPSVAPTILTTFMILSDTHGGIFTSPQATRGLQIPKVDVLLHCGDLTVQGQSSEFIGVINMLSNFDAELKLVIAGNHDLSLDSNYQQNRGPGQYQLPHVDLKSNHEASEYMRGEEAQRAGVTYLEEGLYSFVLHSGAKFTIYTSPHQPDYNGCGWAFSYPRDEDRFNPLHEVVPAMKAVALNPIPDYPDVDIIMTYGPPKGILDKTREKRSAGCKALLWALSRARPKLHCFGHIHEAMGASVIMWRNEEEGGVRQVGSWAIDDRVPCSNPYPQPLFKQIPVGKGTLVINASIQDGGAQYAWNNDPWIVQLELEVNVPQVRSVMNF